ncbi:MAG: DUF6531 domain-containing protein, partial [Blastocatellia bacterium]
NTGAIFLNEECFCPPPLPGKGTGNGGPTCGDPVDMSTGISTYDHTDLSLQDVLPIQLGRSYRELDTQPRSFGVGTAANYDLAISGDANGAWTAASLILPNAARVPYQRTSGGSGLAGAVFNASSTPGIYFGSILTWTGAGLTLRLRNGTQMLFGAGSLLASITDRNGNSVQVTRDPTTEHITAIISPSGRWIALSYNSHGAVASAQDNTGRTVAYGYDGSGQLTTFTAANGDVTSYAYDGTGRMVSYTTPNGNVHGNNRFDSNSRVVQQAQPDGGQYNFSYLLDGNGNVTEADMTDPIGSSCNLTFDSNGYSLSDTWAVGKPEQQATTYNHASSTELLNSTTDPLGRTTAYTYDTMGNLTSITRLSGTAHAVTTSATYVPIYSQLTSLTDPLSHVWTLAHDGNGNLTAVTDPLGHQVTASYNGAGQITSLANAAGTLQFGYAGGDLSSITDPLGKVTTLFTDS